MFKSSKKKDKWTVVDPDPTDLATRMSSQESVTTQLSIPSTPREESILETYFTLLSQSSFDKAKELVDSEKSGHKFSVAHLWGETLQCLSQLASAERSYSNLVFLTHKRFTQIVKSKDGAKSIYSMLLQEFLRMENMSPAMRQSHGREASPSDDIDCWLSHISSQLSFFVRGRLKMIEFYEQLSNVSSMRQWVSFEDLVVMCEEIMKDNIKKFHHPLVSPLKTVFSYECESLCHLMQAQILMSTWSYLPCILQIHEAHSKLNSWGALIPIKEDSLFVQVKSAFGARSSKTQQFPPLHCWLTKFKAIMLSKFGLYFYDVLAKQTMPPLLKTNLAKTSEDFVGKIQTFVKKCDAHSVYLVLESRGLHNRVAEGGYHHPKKHAAAPQGMDTYPPIFAYPVDRVINPLHWPNLVMNINSTPDPGDKLKVFYDKATDKRPQSTYFIVRVDPRVSMVTIFESKKSEKDSTVNSFMLELASHLRCHNVLASLRSYAKS